MRPSYCLLCVSYISIPSVSVDLPGLQVDIEEFVTRGELEPLFYTPVTLAPDILPAKEEKIMHPGAGPGGSGLHKKGKKRHARVCKYAKF